MTCWVICWIFLAALEVALLIESAALAPSDAADFTPALVHVAANVSGVLINDFNDLKDFKDSKGFEDFKDSGFQGG